MSKLRRFFVLFFVALACSLFASGCDDVIADPNFHTWCGDQLCSWKLESGEIRKSPTWHPKDFGVELLDGTGPSRVTAISQVVGKTPKCLDFSVVADVAPEAQVSVSVDFGADGSIEYEQPIAATGFREQRTQITAPPSYVGLKFTISKKGTGRAVLAQMDVRSKSDCTAAPLALKPQSIGSRCPFYKNDVGELAWDGRVCSSGLCCEGVCAECCGNPRPAPDGGADADADASSFPLPPQINICADGATCKALDITSKSTDLFGSAVIPRQCDPGMRERAPGTECLLGDDCASGDCQGAEWTLVNKQVDGGTCPLPPLQDPACSVSFVHGGRCR
jgi:hypothetical protein